MRISDGGPSLMWAVGRPRSGAVRAEGMLESLQSLRRLIPKHLAPVLARGCNLSPEDGLSGGDVQVLTAIHTPLAIALIREHGRTQILFSLTDRQVTPPAKWADISYARVATGVVSEPQPVESTSLQSQAQRLIEVLDELEEVAQNDWRGASRRLDARRYKNG